jgi:thymidine kinase
LEGDRVKAGKLTVFCGPMFSGKTEELLRALNRAKIAELGVQVFVPQRDDRYGVGNVVSHSAISLEHYVGAAATPIETAFDLHTRIRANTSVVGIDEAQFFSDLSASEKDLYEITDRIIALLHHGIHVYVSGLDMDYRGMPFGPMPQLLAIADNVVKCKAVCMVCKKTATHTYRKVAGTDQVLIGADDAYEARCKRCHKLGIFAGP